jgi:hypothetical protein
MNHPRIAKLETPGLRKARTCRTRGFPAENDRAFAPRAKAARPCPKNPETPSAVAETARRDPKFKIENPKWEAAG